MRTQKQGKQAKRNRKERPQERNNGHRDVKETHRDRARENFEEILRTQNKNKEDKMLWDRKGGGATDTHLHTLQTMTRPFWAGDGCLALLAFLRPNVVGPFFVDPKNKYLFAFELNRKAESNSK